ncbi:NAD(P)H-binding protein [Salinimicrobium sp. TH3]|nr:NAD(P)H-binding protein [Salinimicrobium sp. TH3]
MNKENVLVAGANGTTGRIIIDLLKKSNNYNPVAMVRKKEQVEDFEKK